MGKLYLSGGGDEIKTKVLDEIFLQDVKKILYIPLAWKSGNYEGCKEWFTKMLSSHNKNTSFDTLINLEKEIDLKTYDAIYIGGGNTFKLLKAIKESEFSKKIMDYYNSGGIIYGGSAGAIIFGKDISIAMICEDKDENKVDLKDTSGINILRNHDIQCHFEDNQIKEHQEYIEKTKTNIIAIPEDSALLAEDGEFKVIGLSPITLITKNESKKYNVNEIITF